MNIKIKTTLERIKPIQNELILLFIYFLVIQFIIGSVKETIKADAVGYYDYLPSVFIHHDINRKENPEKNNPEIYQRINELYVYVDYKAYQVNKYPCGTALLELPFFATARLFTKLDRTLKDGYQRPFHRAIFFAATFYLFLSLVFLKYLLCYYKINNKIILLTQALLAFATSVTNYANFDAGFSHVYSLFVITGFLYFTKSYFTNPNTKNFLWASFLLGLIILIRQINILVLFFVPFLAGSPNKLGQIISETIRKPIRWTLGILILVIVFSIQSLLWYLQTGEFFIYSYQGEGFNFMNPQIINILFSYKKGLFVYTPILLLATLSSFSLLAKKQLYLFFAWFGFFFILTYLLSSWWSWYYGGSYGLRAYIDFYAILFIPFALVLNNMSNQKFRLFIISLSLLTIPVNIIQTIQYKRYILHWDSMDKEKYWKVFLQTKPMYRGILWKKGYDYNNYDTLEVFELKNIHIQNKTEEIIWQIPADSIKIFEKVDIIQVKLDNNFRRNDNTKIVLSLRDTINNIDTYWHNPYLIHFAEDKLNNYHIGLYNYEISHTLENKWPQIKLTVITGKKEKTFRNIEIRFLLKNP